MNPTQHLSSWYNASAHTQPEHPFLQGYHRADVCVVGAGITGLSSAIDLAQKGYRVIVVEGRRVGWGASGRSGGQIIFGYGCEQSSLEKLVGLETAKALWHYSLEGVELVHERIKTYNIDCDYTPGHVHVALKARQVAELQRWQDELANKYHYQSTSFWDRTRVRQEIASTRYQAGLFDANSGHLHPLNYTLGLAKAAAQLGVQIFEGSPVTGVAEKDKVYVSTAHGQVKAEAAVLAGNAYLRHVLPSVEAKLMPVGTYITATEPLGEERCRGLVPSNCAVADVNLALDYFRCSADHRLLFGGRVSYSGRQPFNLQGAMRRRMLNVFPQLQGVKLTHTWGGDIGITVNRAPQLGKADKNIYFAQGYSGHGLAAAGLAGKVMAEAIAGSAERLDVFSRIPHRSFPGGRLLRTPALVLAMTWFRLRDWL